VGFVADIPGTIQPSLSRSFGRWAKSCITAHLYSTLHYCIIVSWSRRTLTMANKRSPKKRRPVPKTVLRLPDLDQAKAAVLNSLSSRDAQRRYRHAIDEFVEWYCSEPRLSFSRTVVVRYRMHLESRKLAPGTVNLRLGAVRRLAYEAADCGLLSPDLASSIRRVKGVKKLGVRLGNWLTAEQGETLWQSPDAELLKGKRGGGVSFAPAPSPNLRNVDLISARAVTATSAEIHARCGQERTRLKCNLNKTQRDGQRRMPNLRTTNQKVEWQRTVGSINPPSRSGFAELREHWRWISPRSATVRHAHKSPISKCGRD
jgi:hypothetical protein